MTTQEVCYEYSLRRGMIQLKTTIVIHYDPTDLETGATLSPHLHTHTFAVFGGNIQVSCFD